MTELTYKVVVDRPTAIGLGGQTAIDMGFAGGNRHVVIDHEEPDGWYSAPISEEEANLLQDSIDQTNATHMRVEGPPVESPAKKSAAKSSAKTSGDDAPSAPTEGGE